LLNLTDASKRPLGGYSGDMKQRLGIAQAPPNDPQLLIVDEPTAGLDPEERVRFRNLLSDLSGERIVVLSTHIVSDIEATATDIALIIAKELSLPMLRLKIFSWRSRAKCESASSPAPISMRSVSDTSSFNRRSDGVHVRVLSDEPPQGSQPVTLEDAYLCCLSRHRDGEAV
jgi:ABC-2 type transport system ATP-binding protein